MKRPIKKSELLFISPLVFVLVLINAFSLVLLRKQENVFKINTLDEGCVTGESYGTVSVNKVNDRIPSKHADMNLELRCYKELSPPTADTINFLSHRYRDDPNSPEFYTIFNPARQIVATSAYQVYDWDWNNGPDGTKSGLLDGDPPPPREYPVTMWGIYADNGEKLHVPMAGYNLGENTAAVVLYAEEDRITLNMTRDDSVANGYTIHFENICVDRNLLRLFRELPDSDQKSREKLPKLSPGQAFGFAKDNEVHFAIRDRGTFMDPRSEESWWSNKPATPAKTPPAGWQSKPISSLCSADQGSPQVPIPTAPVSTISPTPVDIGSCQSLRYSKWTKCTDLQKTRNVIEKLPQNCNPGSNTSQTSKCTAFISDLNIDSKTDINDFNLFKQLYRTQAGQSGYNIISDYTGDNVIGIEDFLEFVINYKAEINQTIPTVPVETTNIYVSNSRIPDNAFTGTVSNVSGSISKPMTFRTIHSDDFGYDGDERALWKSTYTRFAANETVNVKIKFPGTPDSVELRSATTLLPVVKNGNELSFSLPSKPALYYLKTDVDTTPGKNYIETVLLWVDDLANIILTPPSGAVVVAPGQDLNSAIRSAQTGSIVYIQAGIHELSQLNLANKNGLKIILHPDAVLMQNKSEGEFIALKDSQNVEIIGPGEIIASKGNKQTVFPVYKSTNIKLSDFLLYKIHHRDGWTLHVYNSNTVNINNVKIFSGNDGTDPDSSVNVVYDGVNIISQDDALAIKTRGSGSAENVVFKNGFAKSAASALKIGEATVNKPVNNIVFQDSTVYDSDRALVVNPRGEGNIGKVTYTGITVKHMQQYGSGGQKGRTIIVKKSDDGASGGMFSGSQIIFEKLDADFKHASIIKENITVRNSILNGISGGRLMEGSCPANEGNTINGNLPFC